MGFASLGVLFFIMIKSNINIRHVLQIVTVNVNNGTKWVNTHFEVIVNSQKDFQSLITFLPIT